MQLFLRSILIIIITSFTINGFAWQGADSVLVGVIRGRVVSKTARLPMPDVQVSIPAIKQQITTGSDGTFSFAKVPYGTYLIVLDGQLINTDTVKILLSSGVADLRDLYVAISDANTAPESVQIPTVALEDHSLSAEDDGVRISSVSGLLSASRDPFLSAAGFVFGPYRFQSRGYARSAQEVQINGTEMNDPETGGAQWSAWGGLNDVFRNNSSTYGLGASEYAYGGLNGTIYMDAAAASQAKQTRITYSLSNRSYKNRIALTHSSGLTKNGWSYSISASKRWAKEGYVQGTFYDGYSYYAGLSKKIGGWHEIDLITFGAPTRRGKSAPVTQEVYDIAGSHFYNPNWGYQDGVKRNAKVADNFLPVTVLSYRYSPSNTLRWETSIAYQFGKSKNSTLDWYNADNPRPDYYRSLPSYQILNGSDPSTSKFYSDQQIDWARMYNANYINYETINDVNGIAGNNVSGRRSLYVVANDVDEAKKYTLSSNVQKVVSDHVSINGGLQYISQRTESYRQLDDLLGGDFYLNLNQFAFQQNVPDVSFNQYDLNVPNRLIRKGDKYSYDYISRFSKAHVLAQGLFTYNRVDFFVAGRIGYDQFSREGLYRNGLFADASYGKSDVKAFQTYNAKGGITYKANGRNYLFINGSVGQDAPSMENTFISSRTRNLTVSNPTVEKITSMEGGYMMRAPKYNIRAVGYLTDIKDATEVRRYYDDDPAFKTFVNYVMQGVNTRYVGTELSIDARVSASLSLSAVAAIGQAFYTSNPTSVSKYRDNDTMRTPTAREVYISNYYLAAGPQSAYTLGCSYRAKKYWYASINFNYLDRNYISINPDRRSVDGVEFIPQGSAQYSAIVDQEKLPSVFTVDIFGGKSWLLSKYASQLPRSTYLYLNIGVSNLLDNTDIHTGGFEQLRYDFTDNNPEKFAPKYFYGLGRNFFINLSLKF